MKNRVAQFISDGDKIQLHTLLNMSVDPKALCKQLSLEYMEIRSGVVLSTTPVSRWCCSLLVFFSYCPSPGLH